MTATSSQDCDGQHCTTEQYIQEDGEESEECDTAQETGEEGCKTGVYDRSPGHAFDCFEPCWDVVMVM